MIQNRLRFRGTAGKKIESQKKGKNFHKNRAGPSYYTIQNMSDAPDFETGLKRLEEIVKKLENGELSLDSALELFEEGVKLSRFCHTKLEQAERRVEILLKNNSGQPQAVPFESENE